jgi:hypothetical protein
LLNFVREDDMPSIAGLVGPAAIAKGVGQTLALARGANPARNIASGSFSQHLEDGLRSNSEPDSLASRLAHSDAVSIDTIRGEYHTATADFEMQFRQLLREHGIDIGAGIELAVNRQGDVQVAGEHPQQEAIEALFREHPELRRQFVQLDQRASLLRAADLSAELARLQSNDPSEAAAQVRQLLGTSAPEFSLILGPEHLAARFS